MGAKGQGAIAYHGKAPEGVSTAGGGSEMPGHVRLELGVANGGSGGVSYALEGTGGLGL